MWFKGVKLPSSIKTLNWRFALSRPLATAANASNYKNI
jgi:hypothetical protein